MIFVAFGNSPKQFTRLANAVDALAQVANEKIIVQTGYTKYGYKYAHATEFLTQESFIKHLTSCDVAILQGGWGGIAEASLLGCRIVAVPRIKGIEHYHDQIQLIEALESQGVLLGCYDIEELPKIVEKAKTYNFQPIKKGDAGKVINEFIGKCSNINDSTRHIG